MLHTSSELQTGPIVTNKTPKTTVENESSVLNELLTSALQFDLGTVDGIHGKAKSVFQASQMVQRKGIKREQFHGFCKALDLKSSSVRRKWTKIGQMASRFEPNHIKKLLPLMWTTWYPLATCSEADFKKIVDSGKLSRHVAGKTINEILPRQKRKKPNAKRNATITIGDMDDVKTRDLFGRLAALKEQFGFAMKLSPSVAQLIPGV